MLISIDWIKDFVKIPAMTPSELSSRFTLATAEVEKVEVIGECFEKIKVVEVLGIEKHPEADKLNLVTFDLGAGQRGRVVCGASNVRVGMRTPFAPVGTTLPIGFTLAPKKIRGIESTGMLCSEEELGYAEKSSGILELKDDAIVGMTLKEYFNEVSDIILDIDNKSLTHRPDLWGHYGMAREFGAIFEQQLLNPFDKKWEQQLLKRQTKEAAPIKVMVEKDCAGLAYYGLSIDNVKVGESPEWLKRRIKAVGLRPINNIVDISNYVMLELGMPLHIFDRDMIEGDTLHIKKLGDSQIFITLDEEKRQLIGTDTVIADSKKPLVIAGIMGGMNSGVTEKTNKIFIEVANWKAHAIRRTSTRLGLRTDSSQRYEKTLDSKMCQRTMLRTVELLLQLSPEAKVVGTLEYDGENLDQIQTIKIKTSVSKIESVLGKEVGTKRILSIFKALDFDVREKKGEMVVNVPSYRATKDIEFEVDLIEEIGRIVGYDNIDSQSLSCSVSPVHLSPVKRLHRKICDYMVMQAKCYEIMTYPMIGKAILKRASWIDNDQLVILNALSKENDRMRQSMIPSLLEACALNAKNKNSFRLFELGRIYCSDNKEYSRDVNNLAIAYYDREENCFMKLLDQVEKLLRHLGLSFDLLTSNDRFENPLISSNWSGAHPHEYFSVRIMGKMGGVITTVHPLLCKQQKIKGQLSIAIIDLSQFENIEIKDKTRFKPLSKFPHSEFDCTVVADNSTPAGDVLEALNKVKIKELQEVKIKGIYAMSQMQKSITLKAILNDPEKTMTAECLKQAENTIVKTLSDKGFPLKGQ